ILSLGRSASSASGRPAANADRESRLNRKHENHNAIAIRLSNHNRTMNTKHTIQVIILVIIAVVSGGLLFAAPKTEVKPEEKAQKSGQGTDRYTKMANQLVALINAGNYAGIQTNFNKNMDTALPLDKSSAF